MKIISLAAGASLLLSTAAFAADLGSELTNAQTHAGLAAKAGTVDMVHTHMQHALNCLAGPGGDGFDAKVMNPCAQAGGGAIPDASSPAQKTKLQAAAAQLKTGMTTTDMAAAQKIATDASTAIAGAK